MGFDFSLTAPSPTPAAPPTTAPNQGGGFNFSLTEPSVPATDEQPAKTPLQAVVKTLSPSIGGGAMNVVPGQPNTVVNSGHTTYGDEPIKQGMQRDDIVPVGLGGANQDPKNIRYEKKVNSLGTITDPVEKQNIADYKAGKISLAQARLNVLTAKQQQMGLTPTKSEQTTAGQFLLALGETTKNTITGLFNNGQTAIRAASQLASTPFAYLLDRVTGGKLTYGDIAQTNVELAKNTLSPEDGGQGADYVHQAAQTYLKKSGYAKTGKATPTDITVLGLLGISNLFGDPAYAAPITKLGDLAEAAGNVLKYEKVGQRVMGGTDVLTKEGKVIPSAVTEIKAGTQEYKQGNLRVTMTPTKEGQVVVRGYKSRFGDAPEVQTMVEPKQLGMGVKNTLESLQVPEPSATPGSPLQALHGEVNPLNLPTTAPTAASDFGFSLEQAPATPFQALAAEQQRAAEKPFAGFSDLTTNVLDRLQGHNTVSKQFIADLTNAGDIKQVERDLIRKVLDTESDKVNVAQFAEKVKAELLPLTRKKSGVASMGDFFESDGEVGGNGQYENITLPANLRGNVKDYSENIYESPIKTSAGDVHFRDSGTEHYFGHTRIEDMAGGKTRRVIEVQSDLYQKGNLERERFLKGERTSAGYLDEKQPSSLPGFAKLQQYTDPTAHFRMIREEVKQAAKDGKTKLQFPTGETAMKIEGLGQAENTRWRTVGNGHILKSDELKVGEEINSNGQSPWIITDVLGDGKFKAVTKDQWDGIQETIQNPPKGYIEGKHESPEDVLNRFKETFDISGKVDTNNPIYKFYEKDVGKYLKNNYSATKVTDDKGVTWWQLPVTSDAATKPVNVFSDHSPAIASRKAKIGAKTGTGEAQHQTADEVLNEFKNRLMHEDPHRMVGRDVANRLAMEGKPGFTNPGAMVEDIKAQLEKIKQGQEDSKFGEALRSYQVGERDLRITKTNQLRDKLAKILSPREQEALTFYRDFKGKANELGSLLSDDHFKPYKEIINLAAHPTPAMLAADKAITTYYTGTLKEGRDLGFLDSKISNENYITHLLAPAEEGPKKTGPFAGAKIGRRTPFSKARKFETVADAIKAGVRVKTLNALDALTIYGEKHAIAASTKLFLNQLKDSGIGKFGFKGSEHIPTGWVPADPGNRYFRNTVPFIDKETGEPNVAYQDLYVPQKVADAIKPLVATDFTGQIPGFTKTRLYQSYLKSVQLGLSIFHIKAMNITAFGNQGAEGLVKSYANDMKSPAFLEQEKDFVQHGGTTSILGRTFEAYKGLRDTSIPSRLDLLKNVVPGIKQIDALSRKLTDITFDVMQRKFKVTDYSLKVAKFLAKNPTATEAELLQAKRAFSKEVNAAYGGLNWEILGWNRATLNISRLLALAPDWLFSNWYNAKYAFTGGPAGAAARTFWLRSMITGAVLGYLTSTLMNDGKPPKPSFQNFTNVNLGKDKYGKDIYQNLYFAGAPSDAINLANNVADYGLFQGFAQTLAAKGSATVRELTQFYTNRNYLGQQIVPKGMNFVPATGRFAYSAITNLAPIPFSLSTLATMFLDPKKQYTMKEFITSLAGTRPRHVVPEGMREVTSGNKKGQLVPAKVRAERPLLEQITSGQIYQSKKK